MAILYFGEFLVYACKVFDDMSLKRVLKVLSFVYFWVSWIGYPQKMGGLELDSTMLSNQSLI